MNSQQRTAGFLDKSHGIWLLLGCSAAAAIIYFSLHPDYPFKPSVVRIPLGDTLVHLGSFALVTFFFSLSTTRKLLRLAMVCGMLALAAALEVVQAMLFAINLEFADAFSNMAGVVLGYLVAIRIRMSWRRQELSRSDCDA